MGYRYIGKKTSVLNNILHVIEELVDPGSTIVDLMAGTASVAAALRINGYSVIANDVMTYSFHHAVTQLLFTKMPNFEEAKSFISEHYYGQKSLFEESNYEKIISALNNVKPIESLFFKEYSLDGQPENGEKPRNYFSSENAKKIDGIRRAILELHVKSKINDLEHSLLLHDLILAANDIANIAGTYGHYLSKTIKRSKDSIRLKPSQLILRDDSGKHKVYKSYAEEISKSLECSLCYIDPPYMKRQYAANYHILETLAREDFPETIGVSGLRPWRDQYSNFCSKRKIHDSFDEILSTMDCRYFVVSYSEDGLLSLDNLVSLLKKHGRVEVNQFNHKRFKSNNSDLDPEITEYLLILSK